MNLHFKKSREMPVGLSFTLKYDGFIAFRSGLENVQNVPVALDDLIFFLKKFREIVGCFISPTGAFCWNGNGNRFMLAISNNLTNSKSLSKRTGQSNQSS